MAIVADHFEITVKLVDEGTNFSTLTFQCQDATYAGVVIDKTALVAALANVSGCEIQRVSINEVWKNDSFSYPTDVETANKLSMTIELEGGIGKKANLKLPGPLPALFGASGTEGFHVHTLHPRGGENQNGIRQRRSEVENHLYRRGART